jgi:hypothetical protein
MHGYNTESLLLNVLDRSYTLISSVPSVGYVAWIYIYGAQKLAHQVYVSLLLGFTYMMHKN